MMPDDRFQRWVDASSAAGAIEPSMTALVQGLGRFDCRLIEEDARFSALNQEQSSSSHREYSSRRPIDIVLFLDACGV